jgi:hypothetical protein
MPINTPQKSPPATALPKPDAFDAIIRQQVLTALGRKGDGKAVRVRPLWKNYYRVNVLLGTGPLDGLITHSYFLTVDEAGAVIESTPALAR